MRNGELAAGPGRPQCGTVGRDMGVLRVTSEGRFQYLIFAFVQLHYMVQERTDAAQARPTAAKLPRPIQNDALSRRTTAQVIRNRSFGPERQRKTETLVLDTVQKNRTTCVQRHIVKPQNSTESLRVRQTFSERLS